MTNEIILLLDYKNNFSYKWSANPYRSGMDVNKIIEEFNLRNFEVNLMSYSQINLRNLKTLKNKFILYTSSEDDTLLYKSYIEDIIYAMELNNLNVIPNYKFLRAHHNKVFMELIRDSFNEDFLNNIKSKHYGSYEEVKSDIDNFNYPVVLKSSFGSTSKGVKLLKNKIDARKKIKKISSSFNFINMMTDRVRSLLHKGYIKDSKNRNKFIVQNFIRGLNGDFKILIFGNKYFILNRGFRKNDFRASGSGIKSFPDEIPDKILDFSETFFNLLNSPCASIDVGFNGEEFFLIEFQLINFGTYTIDKSPFYFQKTNGAWKRFNKSSTLEVEFAESVSLHIKNNIIAK